MEKKVGVAILGLSRWSHQLAAAIQRTTTMSLVTCFSNSPENRQAFANKYECKPAASVEEALQTPGVEGAIIASPPYNHLELSRACIKHGVPIFLEKPMAGDYFEARTLAAEVEKNGLALMIGHEMRRLGSMRALKRLLDEEFTGRIAMASGVITLIGSFTPDSWRSRRETNAGALMQLGIHPIETLIYLLGPVTEVQGYSTRVLAPVAIDDVGMATFRFENGAVASVTSNYVTPAVFEIHLYGEKANLNCVTNMSVWPDAIKTDATTSLTYQSRTEKGTVPFEPQDPLMLELDEFARSIWGETVPETGAKQALAAMAVVQAALLSHQHGKPVDPRSLSDQPG